MGSVDRAIRRRMQLCAMKRSPNRKYMKRIQRRAQTEAWKADRFRGALAGMLAAAGHGAVYPPRPLDEYHARIAARGTTISHPNAGVPQ